MKYIYYTLTLGLLTLFSCSQENNENQNAKQSKDLSIPNDLSNYIPLSEVLYIRSSDFDFDKSYYCLKKDSSRLNGTGFYFATMNMQSYFRYPIGFDETKDSICVLEFKDGKVDGYLRKWYKNTKLSYSGYFDKGYLVNKHLSFSMTGDTLLEENYELINLPRKLMQDTILFSAKQGIYKSWYPDTIVYANQPPVASYGGLEESMFYKNDTLHGLQKTWFPDGQLQWEGNYKNGNKDGQFRRWYENGQLKEESIYVKGKKEGTSKSWHENGQLEAESIFVNGKLNGEQLSWHENGKMWGKMYFIENKKDSIHYEWYENEVLKSERHYNSDQLIKELCFDEKGKEIKCNNGWY